jgi:hypothetical protein
MSTFAPLARTQELVASIRHSLAAQPADANGIITAIQGATGETRLRFRDKYWKPGSGLKTDITSALSAADLQRVEQALNQP